MTDQRTCSTCGEPRSRNDFRPDPRATDGLRRQCRKCESARAAERKRRRKAAAASGETDGSTTSTSASASRSKAAPPRQAGRPDLSLVPPAEGSDNAAPPPSTATRAGRVSFVARLVARRLTPARIREVLSDTMGRTLSQRTVERLIADARDELRGALGATREELIEESLADYRALIRDPMCPARDRIMAQRGLDQLLGLKLELEAEAQAEAPPPEWLELAQTAEQFAALRERLGLPPIEDVEPGHAEALALVRDLADVA